MSSHDGPSLKKVAWHQFVLQHQQFVARQFDQSRVDDEFVSGFLNGRRTRSLAPCLVAERAVLIGPAHIDDGATLVEPRR